MSELELGSLVVQRCLCCLLGMCVFLVVRTLFATVGRSVTELLAVPRRVCLGRRVLIGHVNTRLLELEDVLFVFEVLESFLDLLDTGLDLHVEFGMVCFWVFD